MTNWTTPRNIVQIWMIYTTLMFTGHFCYNSLVLLSNSFHLPFVFVRFFAAMGINSIVRVWPKFALSDRPLDFIDYFPSSNPRAATLCRSVIAMSKLSGHLLGCPHRQFVAHPFAATMKR